MPAALLRAAKRLCSPLFSLLYPDDCRICGQPLKEISRIPVCAGCLKPPAPLEAEYFCACCRTPFANPHPLDQQGRCAACRLGLTAFDAAWSFGVYEGRLRELIHLFKYSRIQPLAGPLSAYLATALPRDQRFDLVAPLPLHWLRRWRRGFNQSELLARAVARRCGIPMVAAVRRTRATMPQTGLSPAGRRDNVRGSFAVKRRCDVRGRRILLIDDVLTTGATAGACAAVLKRAGARYVAVLTVARADRRFVPPSSILAPAVQAVPVGVS